MPTTQPRRVEADPFPLDDRDHRTMEIQRSKRKHREAPTDSCRVSLEVVWSKSNDHQFMLPKLNPKSPSSPIPRFTTSPAALGALSHKRQYIQSELLTPLSAWLRFLLNITPDSYRTILRRRYLRAIFSPAKTHLYYPATSKASHFFLSILLGAAAGRYFFSRADLGLSDHLLLSR